jgi:hypothetical protein
MSRFLYPSGHEVKPGDRIRYHGEPGDVQFVVTEATGEPSTDWFLEEFPGGGVMLTATGFGSVFLADTHTEDALELIARSDRAAT